MAVFLVHCIKYPGSHLTVGLGHQSVPDSIFFCQLMIIFNDTVVDQGHPPGAVGMGVFICDTSMGCPSCMADSAVGYIPCLFNTLPESSHLSYLFDDLYL